MTKNYYARLHIWSFGFALGILWGLSMLLTGWVAMTMGWGEDFVFALRAMYIGYDVTFWGSVIGGIWGFVDMFIGGVILAWLYNLFLPKSKETND